MATSLIERLRDAVALQDKEQQFLLQKEAVSLCEQVIEKAYQHNLQEEVYKSHSLLGRIWIILGNPEIAFEHFEAAIAQIERILDDLVYDLSPSFLQKTWAVYEDMIVLCLQQAQPETALGYLEQARSMALRQYLNKPNTLNALPGEAKEPLRLSISQSSRAMMLRLQQELKEWQERYRHYNVLLAEIDTSVSPTVNREVIEVEMKRCEVKISEIFERLHLNQSTSPLKSSLVEIAHRQERQVDIIRFHQQLSPGEQFTIASRYWRKPISPSKY